MAAVNGRFAASRVTVKRVAEQLFAMYRLAPGEKIQLRDPEGAVIDERIDMTRPHAIPRSH